MITNIREIKLLTADLPANFDELAEQAGMGAHDETSESGPRWFVDFIWVEEAENQEHPLVKSLLDIQKENPNHYGITLESL